MQVVPLSDKSGRIVSSYTGREYMSKHNISCQSCNLIYCITCKRCTKRYVGQTGDSIHKRFGEHSGSIGRRNLKEDVGRHFSTQDHLRLVDMSIAVMDFFHAPPKSKHALTLQLQIEFNWIQRLRTMLPMGLNIKVWTPLALNCRNWRYYRKNCHKFYELSHSSKVHPLAHKLF